MIQKLRQRQGKTLLLALVFLLFTLLLGSAVLAAATANAGSLSHRQAAEEEAIHQRCAMLLMAQLLEGTQDVPLQLPLRDVTVTTGNDAERTLDCGIHSPDGRDDSLLQKLLYTYAVSWYEAEYGIAHKRTFPYSALVDQGWAAQSGTLQITAELPAGEGSCTEILEAEYGFSQDLDFWIRLENANGGGLLLTMKACWDRNEPIVITIDGRTTKTVTTVIRWEEPVIRKGGSE